MFVLRFLTSQKSFLALGHELAVNRMPVVIVFTDNYAQFSDGLKGVNMFQYSHGRHQSFSWFLLPLLVCSIPTLALRSNWECNTLHTSIWASLEGIVDQKPTLNKHLKAQSWGVWRTWGGDRVPQSQCRCRSSWWPFFVSQLCSLLHVHILNKDSDLLPVNIYTISEGIKSIDFHPPAHIWSSHCGQRLKDLYLALPSADLSVETENLSVHMKLEGSAPKISAGRMQDLGQ